MSNDDVITLSEETDDDARPMSHRPMANFVAAVVLFAMGGGLAVFGAVMSQHQNDANRGVAVAAQDDTKRVQSAAEEANKRLVEAGKPTVAIPTPTAPQVAQAGPQGAPGSDGSDGSNGRNGTDGVGVISITCTSKGWVVRYTDGRVQNAGRCVGFTGPSGPPGPTTTASPGKDGKDGVDGQDGVNGTDGTDGSDGKDGSDANLPSNLVRNLACQGPNLVYLDVQDRRHILFGVCKTASPEATDEPSPTEEPTG